MHAEADAIKTRELQRLVHAGEARGRVARVAVGVMTALHAVSFVLMRIRVDAADVAANKEQIRVVLVLLSLGSVLTGGLYLFWLVAAVAAARVVGREMGGIPTPMGAVTAYVMPIVGFYRPARHMQRLLEASDPGDLPAVTDVRARETAGYRDTATERVIRPYRTPKVPIRLWWVTWIAGSIVSSLLFPGTFSPHGDAIAQAESTAVADALHVAAGVLCIMVVGGIMAMQRERLRRIVATRSASDHGDASGEDRA